MRRSVVAAGLIVFAAAQTPAAPGGTGAVEVVSPAIRISDVGPDGSPDYAAISPAIAYNANANEYLVVWAGIGGGVSEIFGQRVDAATGQEVGPNDFQIGSGNGFDPAIAYNTAADEYLVVWTGSRNPQYYELEIVGQRIDADGSAIGAESVLTVTGPSAPITGTCNSTGVIVCPPSLWSVHDPVLVYNPNSNEYLVAYRSHAPLLTGRGIVESISAVILSGDGVVTASTGITSRAWDHDTSTLGRPALAHNPINNQYAILWTQYLFNDLSLPIYRITATRLAPGGSWLASDAAVEIVPGGSLYPTIAHNRARNEYIVIWDQGLVIRTLYGRRLSAANMAAVGSTFSVGATEPYSTMVEFDPARNQYLVGWTTPAGGGPQYALARRVSDTGDALGEPISIGRGNSVALAYGGRPREFLVAWSGHGPGVTGEFEIFGLRYAPSEPIVVGLGSGGSGEYQLWGGRSTGLVREATQLLAWPAYNTANGELHPAAGDIDGDGLAEIVMGLGSGGDGWLAIMDDASHGSALLAWVRLPWPSYNASNGTIWPAVGDIDGDGRAEIVAGLGNGGEGYYAIFDDAAHGYALLTWRRVNWSWYNTTQSGETRPAVANIDGGSFSEIVIGLGPGGGGWMELVDDADAGYAHLRWLRVGWSDYIAGPGETFPAAGDVDGDGYDEIVVGLGLNSQGWLQVFDDAFQGLVHKGWLQVSWSDYANTNGETHPAVGDIDGDAAHEIVLGLGVYPGQGGWFEVRDDFPASFTSVGWRNVGRGDFYAAGGATFPAASRR